MGTIRSVAETEATFARERPRLLGLAYRILGSRVDAEDVVQEAWIRWRRLEPSTVRRPEAWLTTVVTRLALDELRSARHRRETYVGEWLPEPVRTASADASGQAPPDPADTVALAESLATGFMTLLESLPPIERVVFLLADVFEVPHARIAEIVDRSPEACRQVASRARRKVREAPAGHTFAGGDTSVLDELVTALAAGRSDTVLRLLADDAVLVSDGGGVVRAALRPVVGRERVARFLLNITKRVDATGDVEIETTELNSEPAIIVRVGGRWFSTLSCSVVDGRATRLHMVTNPDKLAALDLVDPIV